jgi:NAD+ diphosphatase
MRGIVSAALRGADDGVSRGWGRRCPGCGLEHFPRVDPVAIMLAEHEGRVLLGRQPRYPAGRYSALAGFIEPGESIEEAVARELMEEGGSAVSDVRYLAEPALAVPGLADDRLHRRRRRRPDRPRPQ